MIDIFITIVAAVLFAVIFLASAYIVIRLQHPDDEQASIYSKVICVLTFTFTMTNILLLPLDVASRSSFFGGIPMDYLWYCMYILIAFFLIFLVPYTIFYYQSEDSYSSKSPAGKACLGMGIVVVLFAIYAGVGYIYLGYAEVPVYYVRSALEDGTTPPSTGACGASMCAVQTLPDTNMEFKIPLILFIVSSITIVSYFFFMLFGGIGFIAAPLDLIESYIYRPQPIDKDTYIRTKLVIAERTKNLIQQGLEFREKKGSRKEKSKWKSDVHLLDEWYEDNELAYKKKGGPLIIYIFKLILGIFCLLLTLAWLIHIILWCIWKYYPFLNFLFVGLDNVFPFFGTIIYAIFSFYLLFCVMRGNFKFGIRIPVLFSVYPLKKEGTLVTGILINGGLLLLCSVAVVKFCTDAFSLYARMTVVNTMFSLGTTNLRYLKYFWQWYYLGLLGIVVISFFYFVFRPLDRDKKTMIVAQKKARTTKT